MIALGLITGMIPAVNAMRLKIADRARKRLGRWARSGVR